MWGGSAKLLPHRGLMSAIISFCHSKKLKACTSISFCLMSLICLICLIRLICLICLIQMRQ